MELIIYWIIFLISVVILGETLWYFDKSGFKKRFSPYINISQYKNRYNNYGKSFFITLSISTIIIIIICLMFL